MRQPEAREVRKAGRVQRDEDPYLRMWRKNITSSGGTLKTYRAYANQYFTGHAKRNSNQIKISMHTVIIMFESL